MELIIIPTLTNPPVMYVYINTIMATINGLCLAKSTENRRMIEAVLQFLYQMAQDRHFNDESVNRGHVRVFEQLIQQHRVFNQPQPMPPATVISLR